MQSENTQLEQIAVGSKNPVKVASALNGFQTMFPNRSFAAAGFAADSGVSDQPMSSKETLEGAWNRAQQLNRIVSGESVFCWTGGRH